MVLGIEAGDQGVVVREGDRRIGGDHAFRRGSTFLRDCQQVLCTVFSRVVPAETIERDQDNIMLVLLRGIVRPVICNNDRL